jgi:hypothetical protein
MKIHVFADLPPGPEGVGQNARWPVKKSSENKNAGPKVAIPVLKK